jgi:hypothetical protein
MSVPIPIYQHDPATLLELLETQLPCSLPVYGCIKNAQLDTGLPITTADTVYATFPPTQIPTSTAIWVVIYLNSLTSQARMYCSAEKLLRDRPSLGSGTDGGDVLEQGRMAVLGFLEGVMQMLGGKSLKVGGVHTCWGESVRESWGVGRVPLYGVWVEGGLSEVLDGVDGYLVESAREEDIDEVCEL